jgi:electron transport complex protein RnfG
MSIINEKIKRTHAYPALLMGIVSLIVCSLLLVTHYLTAQPIADRQREDLTKLLNQVLPNEAYDNQPLDNRYQQFIEGRPLIFYRARRQGKVSAIILFTSTSGYSGAISMLVAINADGSLSGVRVLSHTETPGLGDKIELAKSDWILGFTGLSLTKPNVTGWAVKKDGGEFDAFTGATITPRAVVKGVYETLQLFENNKQLFLEREETEKQTTTPAKIEPSQPISEVKSTALTINKTAGSHYAAL